MKKTILLGTNIFDFHIKINVWVAAISGAIFIAGGIMQMSRYNPLDMILGVLWTTLGAWYLVYGLIIFNPFSKFAPRFSFDAKELLFKKSLSNRPITIDWDQIQRIEMGPYNFKIAIDGLDHTLDYQTSSEISKEIKSTVREMAESKNIKVFGG